MLHMIRRLAPLSLLVCCSAQANGDVFCGMFDGNCLPVIDSGNPLASFVSNTAPVLAAPSLVILDSTDIFLHGATVQFGANFHPGENVLAVADYGNITSSYNIATGTLTLTGPLSRSFASNTIRANASRRSRSSTGIVLRGDQKNFSRRISSS
jgi:hypothetical protein